MKNNKVFKNIKKAKQKKWEKKESRVWIQGLIKYESTFITHTLSYEWIMAYKMIRRNKQ